MEPPDDHGYTGALAGAYRKGWRARVEGLLLGDCPYKDRRKMDGRVTFSRAFRKAWHRGWRDRDLAIEEAKARIPAPY